MQVSSWNMRSMYFSSFKNLVRLDRSGLYHLTNLVSTSSERTVWSLVSVAYTVFMKSIMIRTQSGFGLLRSPAAYKIREMDA